MGLFQVVKSICKTFYLAPGRLVDVRDLLQDDWVTVSLPLDGFST